MLVQESVQSPVIRAYRNSHFFLQPLFSRILLVVQDLFLRLKQFIQRFSYILPWAIEGYYSIEEYINSPATQVMFARKKVMGKEYCIKRWRPCSNGLYETKEQDRRTQYTINGWDFNCQFAPNVYKGIVPIQMFDKKVFLGKNAAQLYNFEKDVEYALVMRRLDRTWQLDYQLHPKRYGTKKGMNFLAREIAQMHKRLRKARSKQWGSATAIKKKWCDKNRPLFSKCLDKLLYLGQDVTVYQFITDVMDKASTYYTAAFDQRSKEHIKRCHGDLKATNLWICPENLSSFSEGVPPKLLALDCVDFEPQFYYIDTLSDVAMLAVDIEVTIPRYVLGEDVIEQAYQHSQHFLNSYLLAAEEMTKVETNVNALLEYYMTEKALICAYMNILFDIDENVELGKKYLASAARHAKLLQQRMEKAEGFSKISKTRKRDPQQDHLLSSNKHNKKRDSLKAKEVGKRKLNVLAKTNTLTPSKAIPHEGVNTALHSGL